MLAFITSYLVPELLKINNLKNNFLITTWRRDRKIFLILAGFIILQAFFTWKGVETVPFFNYGMYSEKFPPRKEYSSVFLTVNHSDLDIPAIPADYLTSILNHYTNLKEENFEDPIGNVIAHRFSGILNREIYQLIERRLENDKRQVPEFHQWLFRYLNSFSSEPVNQVVIIKRKFEWQNRRFALAEEQVIDSFSVVNPNENL